jgi:nucleoid-associated protein YgaU
MKRFIIVAILAVAGLAGLAAQSLVDNSYYQRSLELKAQADRAFQDGDYDAAADYAAQAQEYASLSDQFVEKMLAVTAADKAIAQAKAKAAAIDADLAKRGWPDDYATAVASLDAANAAYGNQDYLGARTQAERSSAAWDAIAAARSTLKGEADTQIAAAKERLTWAESVKAATNWPAEYGRATGELGSSLASYDKEDYQAAVDHAKAVLAALASVTAEMPFPATYTVRLIPARRDCLWRIAEYSFIYNDPFKWKIIYEANKKTFRDPSNPNLIFPGQVLVIPPVAGETRSGSYDPSRTYSTFPKK